MPVGSIPTTSACRTCGAEMEYVRATKPRLYCSNRCRKRAGWQRPPGYENGPDRARRAGVAFEYFDKREIYERDEWRCGICGEPVDPSISWPDQRSASLDHVIAIADGGPHLRSNVQLAHLGCNIAKGSGG